MLSSPDRLSVFLECHRVHEELDENDDVGDARGEMINHCSILSSYTVYTPDREHTGEGGFRYCEESCSSHRLKSRQSSHIKLEFLSLKLLFRPQQLLLLFSHQILHGVKGGLHCQGQGQ